MERPWPVLELSSRERNDCRIKKEVQLIVNKGLRESVRGCVQCKETNYAAVVV